MSGLNASQQRYVTAVLAEVGRHLDSVESTLAAEQSSLKQGQAGFSADECSRLQTFMAEMRADIRKLISQLAIVQPETGISSRWSVHTHLEFSDVEFQELSASKLRGYGALDERTYAELEQAINGLRKRLRNVLEIF